jgi:hypothetical protein
MHPEVCRFVSDTMYGSRLTSRPGLSQWEVVSDGLRGAGNRWLAVEHVDNRQNSVEEADAIATEVARLLIGGRVVDPRRGARRLVMDDILIVAPYNAQVRCLSAVLPTGRVSALWTSSRVRRRRLSSAQ